MADRAEDLIGHYLADLFEAPGNALSDQDAMPLKPAAAANILVSAPSPVASPPAKPELPSPELKVHHRIVTEPAASLLKSLPQAAPAQIFDEPARQQLQNLLDSAWQRKPAEGLAAVASVRIRTDVNPSEPPTAAPPILETQEQPVQCAATPAVIANAAMGKPAWADKSFDSLIIEVAGLKLAIPLIVLGQIFQVSEGFTHLPGQGPLFLGTLHTARGALRVINTALLVMPERYDAGFINSVHFVVSLAGEPGADWQLALGVSRVAQPVSLACDDVLWRGERSKRPWLLGTVKSQMCALLDVAVIRQMFSAGG